MDTATAPTKSAPAPVRVLLIDDSAVVRGMLSRILEKDGGFTVVGTAANGQTGLVEAKRTRPDAIVIDLEMPVMDGLSTVPRLLADAPGVKVLVCSSLTTAGAEKSMLALAAGAFDVIAKPSSNSLHGAPDFARELLNKLGAVRPVPSNAPPPVVRPMPAALLAQRAARQPATRESGSGLPAVLCFGSSTGGPQALLAVFAKLPPNLPVPVLVTQHMPPTFTAILAKRLGQTANRPAHEAVDGQKIVANEIYLAPGGRHMAVERRGTDVVARLLDTPPENFCKPAVDPMLRSVARVWGGQVLMVMLTGMGQDGLAGSTQVVQSGGRVIAQDEASSVVWGMPGAVARAGLCEAILPLGDIPPRLHQIFAAAAGHA